MDPSVSLGHSVTITLMAVVAVAAAAAVGWMAARGVRDRYRHLLAAVEGAARQVTELRGAVDRLHERVQTVDDRLVALEPQVARLERALEIELAAEGVRTAELTGRLAPEAVRALRRHLADLSEAVAASRSGG